MNQKRGSGVVIVVLIIAVVVAAIIIYLMISPSQPVTNQPAPTESVTQQIGNALIPGSVPGAPTSSLTMSIVTPSIDSQWKVGSHEMIEWQGTGTPQPQDTFFIAYGSPNTDGSEFVIIHNTPPFSQICTQQDAQNYQCSFAWTVPTSYTGKAMIEIAGGDQGIAIVAYSHQFSITQ
jgi:hypothetical protein